MTRKAKEKIKDNLKKPLGRPSIYTDQLAERICYIVATHTFGIQKLTKMYAWMPTAETIRDWRLKNALFSAQYARAKLIQADLLAEDCVDISDDDSQDTIVTEDGKEIANHAVVHRSRLRIETRKWLASKLLPKQYGDRMVLEQKTEENAQLKEEIRELREKLDEENKRDY
jgi:hypothetical protein